MTAMLWTDCLRGRMWLSVFEKHHGFACGLEGKLAVLGRVHFGEGNAAVGEAFGRVEHAEAEARAEEAAECDVEIGFGEQVAMDGFDECGEGLAVGEAALEIGAGFDGVGSGGGHVGCVVVAGVDVGDGGAVADDVAGEGPGEAQVVVQEHGVGAGGRAVDGVVGAHHGLRVSFGDGGAEGGEVGVFEVVRGDVDVGLMARGFRAGVHGEVLRRGDDAEVVGVCALHAGDEGDGHATGEEGVFAVGLLAAAPAWVAKDVDVGRPEGEAEELLVLIVADGFVVFGAGFGGDDLGFAVNEGRVPGGGHADDLREVGGGAGDCDAVIAFVPPEVCRDAEPRDGGCVIAHLLDFFFERHLGDERVDAVFEGSRRVHPWAIGGGVRLGASVERKRDESGEQRDAEAKHRVGLL